MGYLPGGVLIAQVTPLDKHLPAGPSLAGAPAEEGAGLQPGRLHQHHRLRLVAPLEVGELALGYLHQDVLNHPFIVHMGLANPLDQVLRLTL